MTETRAMQLCGLKHKNMKIFVTTSSVEFNGEDYGIDRTYLYIMELNKYGYDNLLWSMDIKHIDEKELNEIEELGFDLSKFPEKECRICKEQISNKNTKTLAGWKEVQITSICENCFDKMLK